MSGEKNLEVLIGTMTAVVQDGLFVFVTCADRQIPPQINPVMIFQEVEGTTLILRRDEADAQGLAYEFPCRMITLDIHSALEAVGFIARVATALAAAGMGVNPVAGFFHDHLFVPDGREAEALTVLERLSRDARHT